MSNPPRPLSNGAPAIRPQFLAGRLQYTMPVWTFRWQPLEPDPPPERDIGETTGGGQ
jgi:hypothetical protein